MKKRLFSIICCLFIIISCFPLIACNQQSGYNEGKTTTKLLNSFDSYYMNFAHSWSHTFGRTAVNTNEDYISEGNGSMLVEAYGTWTTENEYPWVKYDFPVQFTVTQGKVAPNYFSVGTEEEVKAKNNDRLKDFSAYNNIKLDVYNTKETDSSIRLSLTAYDSSAEIVNLPAYTYVLKSGWNTVTYSFPDAMKQAVSGLKNVKQFKIEFPDYVKERDGAPVTLYVDNLRATISDRTVQTVNPIKQTTLFDFEDVGQKYFFQPITMGFVVDYEDCVNNVSEGNTSLRVVGNRIRSDKEGWDTYPNSEVLVKALSLPTGKFPEGNKLIFDVFNEFPKDSVVRVKLWYEDGTKVGVDGTDYAKNRYDIGAYEWATIEVPVNDTSKLDKFSISIYKESNTIDLDVHTFILDNIRVGG